MEKCGYVYILSSQRNGTLYIGVTSDLPRRVWMHKSGAISGFTQKYHVKNLVYYERHDAIETAIRREKAMKKWNRKWKLALIERMNPEWRDLWSDITGSPPARG